MQYLITSLSDAEYGINVDRVKEIRTYTTPLAIVGTENYIRGVADIMGDIVPIIDLKKKFNLSSQDDGEIIILISIRDKTHGIIVDAVCEILDIPTEDIKPLDSAAPHGFQSGLFSHQSRNIIIVDPDKII